MQQGRRQILTLLAVAAAAAASGALVGALGLQFNSGAADLLAKSFSDLDGRLHRLREWRGRIVLCNFWATWCAPCREEVPLLVAAKQQFGIRGFEIAGIGIDNAANLAQFAKSYQINYPVLVGDAASTELMRRLGNSPGALPFTLILNRRQTVVYRKLGALTREDLRRELAGLVG